jgi:hypothetical protein
VTKWIKKHLEESRDGRFELHQNLRRKAQERIRKPERKTNALKFEGQWFIIGDDEYSLPLDDSRRVTLSIDTAAGAVSFSITGSSGTRRDCPSIARVSTSIFSRLSAHT